MNVRKATLQDMETISDFQVRMALETENLQLDKDILNAGISAVLNDSGKGFYFVVETNDEVIGSLLVTFEWSDWRNGQVYWIHSVYVKPEHRKKGAFKLLYNHIKSLVETDDSLKGIRLYAETANIHAHKVYKSPGMNNEHYQLFEWLK